ncbi:hypothetical protein TNCV_2523201 [Trichonephila clavipes]|nr:hypothetical protein TNCV_2523201 [Trichonephila clavipes]
MVFERWSCYNNIVHVNGHETPNNRLEDYIDSPWKLGAAPERPKGMRRNAKVPSSDKRCFFYVLWTNRQLKIATSEI